MSKDYPTGEELDKMSEKEEWNKIQIRARKCDTKCSNAIQGMLKQLAIERAKVKEHGLCNKKECKYYNGVEHYKAKVEKLKGENLRLRNARNRLIGIDDAPEGGGEKRHCSNCANLNRCDAHDMVGCAQEDYKVHWKPRNPKEDPEGGEIRPGHPDYPVAIGVIKGLKSIPEGGEKYCTCPQTPNPHTLSAPVSGVTCGLCGKEIMSPQEDPEGGG